MKNETLVTRGLPTSGDAPGSRGEHRVERYVCEGGRDRIAIGDIQIRPRQARHFVSIA